MGWNVTEVRLVTNLNIDGTTVIPPDRPNPAKQNGPVLAAATRLENVYKIPFGDVESHMMQFQPTSNTLGIAAAEVCTECSAYMTSLVDKALADDVVVYIDEFAYRVISGTEHDVVSWAFPRKNASNTDWGITYSSNHLTYIVHLLMGFRMVRT